MEYKVFIFSNNVLDGQTIFNFEKFNKIMANNLIQIESLEIDKYDLNKEFIEDDKNLIVFCDNKNLDDIIIKNINLLGNKKIFINEEIVVFNKDNSKVIFAPIESNLDLLNKIFVKTENKKYCEFHIFGLGKEQILEKLNFLSNEIKDLEYKITYNNLLCDIYLSYNGQSNLIDDNQVIIASTFKQNIYSENEMQLPEIINKMLHLKNKTIAICENITKGRIVNSLLEDDDKFDEIIKIANFINYTNLTNDELYDKTMTFLNNSKVDIAIITNYIKIDNGIEFSFAIADNKEVHIFKNTFKAIENDCIEMAKNSVLFHLAKKLRQNNVSF